MKITKPKEKEIRKLLGNRYHLGVTYDGKITTWSLFKKYENGDLIYYSNDNKAIMTSETHTVEELYEFAKKHHKIDEHFFMSRLNITIACINIILIIINIIFLKSDIIRGIIFGVDIIIVIDCMVAHIIWNKNWNVGMLELEENIKRLRDKNS